MPGKIPEGLQVFLDAANALPPCFDIDYLRNASLQLIAHYGEAPVPVDRVEDLFFESGGEKIPVRLYHPAPQVQCPLLIYYHGGGHANCDLETHDRICRRLAQASDFAVMAVGYRLAPEHPYPLGLEDAIQAFLQREQILKKDLIDFNSVFLAGDSAGGNLALSVAHQLKQDGDGAIQGLVLIYPSVNFLFDEDAYREYGEGYLLTRDKIKWYFDLYFSKGGDRKAASPMYFNALDRLPKVYLALASHDPLCAEGLDFVSQLKQKQVPVSFEVFEGMIHGFAFFEKIVPGEIKRLYQSIGDFLKKDT